jgi:predicted amidophosphoribosyltransferase
MECPRCHRENRQGRRFCSDCEAPLALACHALEDRPAAESHLREAHGLLTALRLPTDVECTERLAAEFGESLSQ